MKSSATQLPPLQSAKVLDQLRERIRYLLYSIRTEYAYVYWVRALIRFHGLRHPAMMGGIEVEAFLSWLHWIPCRKGRPGSNYTNRECWADVTNQGGSGHGVISPQCRLRVVPQSAMVE
jgi:hypothetical protein